MPATAAKAALEPKKENLTTSGEVRFEEAGNELIH